MTRRCQNCEKALTGKQKMFCSDACRKQASRREMSANVRESSGNVRESSGNVREFSNVREFVVTARVKFSSNRWLDDWDVGLINKYSRRKMERKILEMLSEEQPEWKIEVKIDSKMVD